MLTAVDSQKHVRDQLDLVNRLANEVPHHGERVALGETPTLTSVAPEGVAKSAQHRPVEVHLDVVPDEAHSTDLQANQLTKASCSSFRPSHSTMVPEPPPMRPAQAESAGVAARAHGTGRTGEGQTTQRSCPPPAEGSTSGHRVTHLALLDTTARADTPEQIRRRHDEIALTQSGQFAEVVDDSFRRWVHPGRRHDVALQRVVRQMADETGPEAFVRQHYAIMNRPDSRPDLAAIECPTLVLVGADDDLTTPEHATEIAGLVPGAKLAEVPDCGHLSTLEQPTAVTRALVDWLAQ